ncbi:hypothetical protein BGZ47_000860 [Haplosporangium gracile]|nr:hypothetical protein BGZ47_000860 [Haplosporangium gracile]
MRDRLSIILRHHVLLRDEDIRYLDLSDCFCEVVDYQLYGTSTPVQRLVVCLRGGDAIGQVGFPNEPIPDFDNMSVWPHLKVIEGSNPFKAVDSATQNRVTKAAFQVAGIKTPSNNARRSALWIQRNGENGIEHGLHCAHGPLGSLQAEWILTVQVRKIPGAFGMAGFYKMRYAVKRGRLAPALELQQLIFPWIEKEYGGSEK